MGPGRANHAPPTLPDSARQGLARAQYNLGLMYFNGQGVPESRTEGLAWLHKAAERGSEEAVQALARLGVLTAGIRDNDPHVR